MKKSNQSMITGPLFSNIVSFTIPVILTSVLQLLFNAADLVVVGRFRGSLSVGAVGATGSLTALIVNLFIGLSVGAGVSVAQGIGGKMDKEVHQTVHTAIPASIICGIVLTVVGVFISKPLLVMMNTPAEILDLSALYMKIYFCGITFTVVYNFAAAILRAAGDSKSPLIFLTIAGVINVILNVFFVLAFGMDVEGVALATAISQAVSAVLVVIALMRRKDACRLELRKMKIYWRQLGKIVRIGLPAGIQSSLFAISNVIIQSSINSFGDVVVSGNAAAGNIEGFLFVAMNSFHQTAVNFCGQNCGAKRYDRVKKTLLICLGCVGVLGVSLGAVFYLCGRPLLGIYITDSAEAIEYGLLRMSMISTTYVLCGLMDVVTGALRGMGASLVPMLISVLGVCGIRLGWIFTIFRLPQFHSLPGLFLSYPISWAITFAVNLTAFLIIYNKRKRQLQPVEA